MQASGQFSSVPPPPGPDQEEIIMFDYDTGGCTVESGCVAACPPLSCACGCVQYVMIVHTFMVSTPHAHRAGCMGPGRAPRFGRDWAVARLRVPWRRGAQS
eukprot:5349163-Alexandrium_andersonii.AAC.1